MPKDLKDLARTASALPHALQDAQVRGVQRAALAVTKSIRAEIRTATGGDGRLSGVGRRGAKVGARYDVRGRVNPTALITAIGPLHLIDRDTDPHPIVPRGRRVSKRWQNAVAKGKADPSRPVYLSGARALKFSNGNLRPYAFHPGTRGKHVWGRGVAKSAPVTKDIFDQAIHAAVVKAVRG